MSSRAQTAARVVLAFVTVISLATGAAIGAPASVTAASATACRVKNLETGVTRGTFQRAVNAASDGDQLTLRGTCTERVRIRKDLVITGVRKPGSGAPTVAGKGSGSVLSITGGTRVTLKGLTIRGGSTTYGGGGISNAGFLGLRNVTVRDNAAGYGGGIHNARFLRLAGACSVRGNSAGSGGGIFNTGSATLLGRSTISGNRAEYEGGGIQNEGSVTLADASSVAGNVGSAGGGLYSSRGSVTLLDTSTVTGNTADGFNAHGGGIAWGGSTLSGAVCAPDENANIHANTPDDCYHW